MDISTPESLDFLHGGLNFQVPHHLFPRMPRFHFRKAALLVEEWVIEERNKVENGDWEKRLGDKEGLKYKRKEFVQANKEVLGVLKGVAQQVGFMLQVAEADSKGLIEH